MPKSRASGISFSTQKPRTTAVAPIRTKNRGWTRHVSARNRNFLLSVDPTLLTGVGVSFTLTTGDYLPTPDEWKRARKNLWQWTRDNYDLTRAHDICEWQMRNYPHLHGSMWTGAEAALRFHTQVGSEPDSRSSQYREAHAEYLSSLVQPELLIKKWLHITRAWGTQRIGQDWKYIEGDDVGFWLQYTAKHAARGVSNAQRSFEHMPQTWKDNSPQLWHKIGDWPTPPALEICGISEADLYSARRIFCRYMSTLPAHMRLRPQDRERVSKFWRDYLRSDPRADEEHKSTRFKGFSAFIPQSVQLRVFKGINPDAYFMDEETGQIYEFPGEVYFPKSLDWKEPSAPPRDCSDIFHHHEGVS